MKISLKNAATFDTFNTSKKYLNLYFTMNNFSRFIFTALLFNLAYTVFAQSSPLRHTKTLSDTPTQNEDQSVWFKMEEQGFKELKKTTAPLLTWDLQLPGEGLVEITLLESCPFPMFIPVGERADDGTGGVKVTERDFTTDLITFDVTGPGLGGSVVIFDNYLIASIRYKDRLFELRPTDLKTTDISSLALDYVLFDVNDSRGDSHFSCAADDIAQEKVQAVASQKSMVLECVEIAIDIDKYTYDTFGNCDAAINWSLAILAGVDEIYRTSMNDMVTLQASYINIWLTTDPYTAYVENAGAMLDALRSTWLNDETLNATNRDLVHLMTKRSNTGTGGIAWLGVLCDSYGFGFSSYMDNTTSFNIPNFTWNLMVVGHEIGHNFGSPHTQSCGWNAQTYNDDGVEVNFFGGPIDDCVSPEGDCSIVEYDGWDNQSPGTMMSYCHTVSAGITLQFHPVIIEQALEPGVNSASCIGDCAGTVYSCGAGYGCTDPSSCNYDPEAFIDNGACAQFDICDICGGDGSSCTGCTDADACNYDSGATIDDDSCIFGGTSITVTVGGGSWDTEVSWAIVQDNIIITNGTTGSVEICVENGCYTFEMNDSYGDGWNGAIYTIFNSITGEVIDTGDLDTASSGDGSYYGENTFCIEGNEPDIPGCSDTDACNYDSTATVDDGTCDYTSCAGCTASDACNYDSTATLDDGNCDYESCACPNDLNGDGFVSVADILLVLSEFNCTSDCTADVDADGAVTVTDLLALLAAFGQSC